MKTIRSIHQSVKTVREKSLIALTTTSLAFFGCNAYAANVNVTTAETAQRTIQNTNDTLNILTGGSINVSTATAVTADPAITGASIVVNTTNAATGISGIGQRAIDIDSNQINGINLISGRITSNADRTIYLQSAPLAGITNSAGGTIANTSNSGTFYAIDANKITALTNTGNILANTNAANTNAVAIRLISDNTVNAYTITNNGTINAGSGTAILTTGTGTSSISAISNTNNALITGNLNIGGSNVDLTSAGTIIGNILGNTTGVFNVNLTSSGSQTGNITTSSLSNSQMKVELDGTYHLTGNVILQGTSTTSYVQMQGNSIIDGNVSSSIIGSPNHISIFGGQVNGNITGNMQTFISGSDTPGFTYTFNGDVGTNTTSTYGLELQNTGNARTATSSIYTDTVTIDSRSTLYVGSGTMKLNTTDVSGTLDMTSNAVNVTGNGHINAFSGGVINLGQYSHTTTGNLAASANSTIATTITSPTAIGNITTAGTASNSANTNLNVSINYNLDTYNNGRQYTVLTTTSANPSSLNALNDNTHLIVTSTGDSQPTNSTATNRAGVLTYHSAVVQNSPNNKSLIIYVTKDDKTIISDRLSEQNVYEAVDQVGAGETAELKNIQNYIMTSNTTSFTQRQDALASLTPNDIGLHKTVIDGMLASINTTEKRLEEIRDRFRLSKKVENDTRIASSSSYKILDQNGHEIYASEDDETSLYAALAKSRKARNSTKDLKKNSAQDFNDSRSYNVSAKNNLFTAWPSKSNGLWVQGIGTNARQQTKANFDGYHANSYGITVGYDKMIAVNAVLGASISALRSNIDTSGNLKDNDINSYQFNLYAGEFCPTYFLDAVIGMAYNQYDSQRHMPSIGATAKADFNGTTYAGRARAGYITRLSSNWDFIPEADLTYAKNNIESYTETGAGTANLNVKTNDATFVEGAIGASVGYLGYAKKDSAIYPRLKVMYGYALKGFEQYSNSSFVGQNFTFYTQSAKQSRNSLRADLGFNMLTLKSVIVSANYLYEYKPTGFRSHSGVLRVSYQF